MTSGTSRTLPDLASFEDGEARTSLAHLDDSPWGIGGMANWVIPGRLVAGGFLALTDPEATAVLWSALLGELGVTTVVCLNTDDELRFLEDYTARAREAGVNVVRLPIRDGGTADDDELVRLVLLVARCLREGANIYVHCLAGRGRTGVVCAAVLVAVYGLSADAALALIQRFHDSRISPFGRGARSPENDVQRAQVHRVAKRPELRGALEHPPE